MTGYFKTDGPYLMHYGILGMKWGVRRYQNYDGSLTEAGRKQYNKKSADRLEYEAIKKKKKKGMSNAELRKANERMRLEQEYARLSPNVVKTGLKYVGVIAGALGTYTALKSNGKVFIKDGKNFVNNALLAGKKGLAGAALAFNLHKF